MPCAGIHLSGPNAGKSAVVVLRPSHSGDVPDGHGPEVTGFELVRVYEKIGTFGNLFSDDRLVGILDREFPLGSVFIDCPLTQPPCVECKLVSCPGVVHCNDVGVAWMLAVASRSGASGKARRRKVNPQGQRLWDVYQSSLGQRAVSHPNPMTSSQPAFREPTYTSNVAPLVTRARTLQRRLNARDDRSVVLHETSVPMAVEVLARQFAIPVPAGLSAGAAYRNFEFGSGFRRDFIAVLLSSNLLSYSRELDSHRNQLHQSVEVFQALITALVACLHAFGNTTRPVEGFTEAGGGWVHLPSFD